MTQSPFTHGPREGQSFYFSGTLMTVKARSAETNGQFSLIEQLAPPGFATPLHKHANEDETMYILEGIAHAFRVEGVVPARLLQLTTPAGIEQGFIDMGEPAPALALPPPHIPTPEELERMMAISAKYHVEQLGPSPQ
jgi:hypothetical protein